MVRALAGTNFTESWGCGFGFAITNEDRSVAVVLSSVWPATVGTSIVELPDPAWAGEVQFGEDLLGVECQDQDLERPTEPADVWPITGGTLHITAPQPAGCSTPDPATAVVSRLTVEAPDGTIVTLPELTVTNDRWGCAAG